MSKIEFSIVSPFNGELIAIQIECDIEHQQQIKKLFERKKQEIEHEKRLEKWSIEEQERLTKKVRKWECDLCGKVGGLKSTFEKDGDEDWFFCEHCKCDVWFDMEDK